MVRVAKRENGSRASEVEGRREEDGGSGGGEEVPGQGAIERRALRSRYLAVKNLISDDRDNISKADSDKFTSIIGEVESLHQFVQKPREQVADAEALLDIANSLVTSVKSHNNEGMTPADFITALLENFGRQDVVSSMQDRNSTISWTNVGLAVSHVFRSAPGCSTMLGPMNTELKKRKPVGPRKRRMPTGPGIRPEELEDTETEKRTDTDKNMSAMFEILRKHRTVRLENLVLNRKSFAQTVENIFALSFLIKDGRAAITVNDSGHHTISPRNAPAAASVASGQVSFSHFVFRYDFKDWKLMVDTVAVGEELMPHRTGSSTSSSPQDEQVPADSQRAAPTTPIRKLTRNRGLVVQEQSVGVGSPENDKESSHGQKKRLFHS